MEFAHILKANPYHDERGRFTTNEKAKFVSVGGVFDKQRAKAKPESESDLVGKKLDSLDTLPAGKDYVRSKDVGIKVAQNVPFKIPNVPDKMWAAKEPETIDPSKVETFQGYIMKSKVKALVKEGIKDDPITVFRHKEKLYLVDGNHRVAASLLTGRKTLKAKVFDIGNDLKLVKPTSSKKSAFTY